MEIDLLKKKNCDLEVHIEKITQQTPKRINNRDKKIMKFNFHWNLKKCCFFSDKIKDVESTIEEYVKYLDNNIRLGNDLEQ